MVAAAQDARHHQRVGQLWNQFRRGMRRGKTRPGKGLPVGLQLCPVCSEPRGRTRFADPVADSFAELDISCICDGVPCAWCGQLPVHRPGGTRFDATTATVRHSATLARDLPCGNCRADAEAVTPHSPDTADYQIGATPFYGEAARSNDYFESWRYRVFEAGLPALAARNGVTVVTIKRVQGIWRGHHEPSALISVTGTLDAVRAVMVELAERWNQEGVICFRAELDGDARLYTGSTTLTVEEICALLDDDVSGVTVDAGNAVTLLDLRGDQSHRAKHVLAQIGHTESHVDGRGFFHQRLD